MTTVSNGVPVAEDYNLQPLNDLQFDTSTRIQSHAFVLASSLAIVTMQYCSNLTNLAFVFQLFVAL